MRLTLLAITLLAGGAAPLRSQAPDPLVMRLETLGPRVHLISGFANGNILAVEGRRGVILVDGQSERRVALADSALRTVTRLPVRLVASTHYHDDHISGNPHWRRQGARIVGHAGLVAEARKDTTIPERDWHRTPAADSALPEQTFTDSLRLEVEGETLLLLHPPLAHTRGDAIVWFPKRNLVHTGDILEFGAPPFIDWWAGGTLDGMIAATDLILARTDAQTRIVPGHGPVVTRAEVVAYRGMLAALRERVTAGVGAGQSLAQLQSAAPAAEFAERLGGPRRARQLVELLYLGATREHAAARTRRLHTRLSALLDSARTASGWPGVSVAVAFAEGRNFTFTLGEADTALGTPLGPDDLLLAGSVGKTFVAALAVDLASEGKLDLDAPIRTWLAQEPWFARLPNGADITVRQLLNHTSGLVRYEFSEAFTRELTASPDRVWQPAELVSYILGTPAPFAAGQGWDYSDTNYIVLGMILERITGQTLYDAIDRRLLRPVGLRRVVPSTSRTIPGLVQGYAGPANPFGGTDAMIVGGRFAINPQFEWAGGGFATTPADLARWARVLWSGAAFGDSLTAVMLDGVPAKLGPDVRYGLGVILRPTPLGMSFGHSGYFPGYLTEVRYYKDLGLAVAMQFNTSAPGVVRGMGRLLDEIARTAAE